MAIQYHKWELGDLQDCQITRFLHAYTILLRMFISIANS
jgi:hypothetical protein